MLKRIITILFLTILGNLFAQTMNIHTKNGNVDKYNLADIDSITFTIPPSNIPTEGLVAYYPFNGNANDESGNGNNGTIHGKVEFEKINDNLGLGAKFNGYDSYIEIKTDMNFLQNFTISFFLKVNNLENAGLFQKGEKCPDGNPIYHGSSYVVSIDGYYEGNYNSFGKGFINALVREANGNYYDDRIVATSESQIKIDSLNFYAIVFDTNIFKFYLNGQLYNISTKYERGGTGNTVEISPSDFSGIHQTQASLKIGALESYCNLSHYFENFLNGIIDEIRIYNRSLSEHEINLLYSHYNLF